jgi:hypothetical protein
MSEYVSPVTLEHVMRQVDGAPDKSLYNMLEVRNAQTEELLATCMMGDELGVEKIADLLSSKRLFREANRLRVMMQELRRPAKPGVVR